MSVYIDIWTIVVGALCGAGAIYGARGRNKLISGALIGAAIAFVLGLLRGFV